MEQSFNPRNSVKVISNSTTFYPLDTRNEEGLTLINSNAYLFQNFGEVVNSFRAGDKIVVLKMWNGILFSIAYEEKLSEESLVFLLKIIKDTAVFLFSSHFENHMSKNIAATLRQLYAKYIEMFFKLCTEDYKYMLMIPQYDKDYANIMEHIPLNAIVNTSQQDENDKLFIEMIVFRNHKIVTRYTNPSASPLDPVDVFQISLFERMETLDANFDENAPLENITADSIVHRGGNLHFDDNVSTCLISKIQIGKTPFVLIFTTQTQKPTPELTQKILLQANNFKQKLEQYCSIEKEKKKPIYVTGIIHYILVNRTYGTYFEPENLTCPFSENKEAMKQFILCEKIKRKMVSHGIKAFQGRYIASLRNEMLFQYSYELIVKNSKGQTIALDKNIVNKFSNFNNSNEAESYEKFIQYLQNKLGDNNIKVYELYASYLGIMSAKDVAHANSMLFEKLTAQKN